MKRILLILFVLVNSSLLFAGSLSSERHKHKMIKAINHSQYEKAAEEITHVTDWTFDATDKNDILEIQEALDFYSYIGSMAIESAVKDSFIIYLSKESDIYGFYYYNQKDYTAALSYYQLSRDIKKVIFGEHHYKYILTLRMVGLLYENIGDFAETEQYLLNVLKLWQTAYGEQHPNCASAMQDLGYFYELKNDYKTSELYYLEALEIRKAALGELNTDYLSALESIVGLYQRTNDVANYEKFLIEELNVCKSIYGDNHPKYASVLINMGLLYVHQGNGKTADRCFLQALRIFQSANTISVNTAACLNMLWNYYRNKGDYESAESCLLQAKDIWQWAYGDNDATHAGVLHNLGLLYEYKGEYKKAEEYLLKSTNIWRSINGEQDGDYALSLYDLGLFYGHRGDFVKAETYLLKALEIRKSIYGDNHPECAETLYMLGMMFTVVAHDLKAKPYVENMRDIYKRQFISSMSYMSEKQREIYWNSIWWKFLFAQYVYIGEFYKQDPSDITSFAYDNELFLKGLLLNSAESIKRSIFESNDTIIINQWNELMGIRRHIAELQEYNPQSQEIAAKYDQAERIEKTITRYSAAYRDNQAVWQITWDSVRSHLTPNQVAIEYMATLWDSTHTCCALVLRDTCSYPIMIPLFNEPEVTSLVNTTTENQTSFTYSYSGNGKQLSQLVWSKVLPYIKKGETIYFAPSGILHQLAIESLPYDESHMMADIFNLVRLSSTREIVTHKQDAKHTSATLYGGIQYDVNTDDLLAESEKYSTSDLLASRGIEADTLDRGSIKYLKGTKTEVENINLMLKHSNLQVQLFTSTNANEESFKALSGKHQNILHIATHGFFWTDSTAQRNDYFSQRMMTLGNDMPSPPTVDPLNRCGLLFSGAQTAWSGHSSDLPEGVQDGILTAKEISLLDLQDADLVVLSACETGKGEITGDGVFGLQRAFKQAGAQTIIMSLWPVHDAATQLLMTEFYRNWITNRQSKREAFRNAQNTVRSKYEEPYYWAGFIMLD